MLAPRKWLNGPAVPVLAAMWAGAVFQHPDGTLWEAVGNAWAWPQAGFGGASLLRCGYALGGLSAITGIRIVALGFMAWLVSPGTQETHEDWSPNTPVLLIRTALVACGAAIAPWGPQLFGLLALMGVLRTVHRSAPLATAIAFIWPVLSPNFFLEELVALVWCWKLGVRSRLAVSSGLINPIGIWGIVSGTLPAGLYAGQTGIPPFGPVDPSTPAFWVLLLAGAALLMRGGLAEGGDPWAAATVLAAGVAWYPLASAPVFVAARDAEEEGPGPWVVLSASGICLASIAFSPGTGIPSQALRALVMAGQSIPARERTLEVSPRWRSAAIKNLHSEAWSLAPSWSSEALRREATRSAHGPSAPFEGYPSPEGGFLLIAPQYPQYRRSMRLQRGWAFLSAGEGFALFARSDLLPRTGLHLLTTYNPYAPLPETKGEREKALGEVLWLVGQDPGFEMGWRDVGRLSMDLGRLKEAEGALRTALLLWPRDAEAWNDLGAVLQQQEHLNEARDAYRRSIDLNPSELLPRTNLASLELKAGRPDAALDALLDILEGTPSFDPARRMAAQVYAQIGRPDQAAEVLQGIPDESRTAQDRALIDSLRKEARKGAPPFPREPGP